VLSLVLVCMIFSAYFYVEAFKWGMNARRWAAAGLLLGPVVLPMFSISRHIHWRNAVGYNNLFIAA